MSLPHKPRVLLLIPHLGGGGAERVIETLARALSPVRYDIHLALLAPALYSDPQLPETVTVHHFCVNRVRYCASRLLHLIWKIRPNLILSGIAHLNLLVLMLKPLLPHSTRIVVRQNGALEATLAAHSRLYSRRAYSFSYRRADRVICQTQSMVRELQQGLGVEHAKLLILPNPTDLRSLRRGTLPNPGITIAPLLLSVGRLVPEKGFDILLDAFATLHSAFRSSELIIVGSGPQESRLQQQSEALGIQNRVHFVGHVSEPIARFRHASLFVLSSRTEGLPNALLEAAAVGLPIVATPASDGVVDLLQNREGAWLATETAPDTLRAALEQALSVVQPGQRYSHPWIESYDLSCAIPAYEDAINHVIAGSAA